MKTFEEEVLSKPIGQQGKAIIVRLERMIKESKEKLKEK